MERLVMIGRDYPHLGAVHTGSLACVQGCISAGSDPNSPSFAYKGSKVSPNEDGLVALKSENQWLLAVADGHLGHESSHAILDGLSQLSKIPSRLGPLSLVLSSSEWIDETQGGSTLLTACCDQTSRTVFGLSFGDSSLVTIGPNGAQIRNQPNDVFLRGGGPIEVELGQPFEFQLGPTETLLLYTDGVNECCYRDSYRSIRLQHLEELYEKCKGDGDRLAESLVKMALAGVDGHPGGQDNVVVITYAPG